MGKLLSKFKKKTPGEEEEDLDEFEKREKAFQEYLTRASNHSTDVGGRRAKKEISDPLLLAIIENQETEFRSQLSSVKGTLPEDKYEWKECLCFWLAVHMKRFEIAQFLVDHNTTIKRIVYAALNPAGKQGSEKDKESQSEKIAGFKPISDKEESKTGDLHIEQRPGSNNRFRSKNSEKEKSLNSQSDEDEKEGGDEEGKKALQDENFSINSDDKKDGWNVDPRFDEEEQKLPDFQKRPNSNNRLAEGNSSDSIIIEGHRNHHSRESSLKFKTEAYEDLMFDDLIVQGMELEDMETLERVRFHLLNYAKTFNCNILIILYNSQEFNIAGVLLKHYEVVPTEQLLHHAIDNLNFKFLKNIWKYGRNFCFMMSTDVADKFTFTDMLEAFSKNCQDDDESFVSYVRKISKWKMKTNDSFLKALLHHDLEEFAIEMMGYYYHEMNQDLLIFSLDNGKEAFLSKSLELAAFNKFIFKTDEVVEKLLELLKGGTNTVYYLNIMTLIDISLWKTVKIKELIGTFEQYAGESYDNNQLLLSYNPLMTIALACEILQNIAKNRKKLENQATKVKDDLLALGQMYSSKIEDEDFYEELITDTDSTNRSLLKIVTDLEFEPLMDENDPKAENIMMSIYQGKETTKCDGNIKGYSSIYHVITTRPKKVSTDKFEWFVFFKNFFEPNYNFDYNFQYRYRSHSINFIFWKEFLCALGILVIFQMINYEYLSLFNIDELSNLSEAEKKLKIEENIETYRNYNLLAFMFSFSLIAHVLLKAIFNAVSNERLPMDKWTVVDTISALLYITSIFVISNLSADHFLDPNTKDWVDYFVLLVLCMSWIRFFSYFLVIRDISKLLLTLIAMITDTLAFIIIVACFLIIASSVFTTLYQDYNEDKYKNLRTSFRTLFDTSLAVYGYDDMGTRDLSHSILLIIVAFCTNILLLNFVIAILSTTYENMKESGIFRYKSNLFKYCQKYLIAFRSEYSELVLQPAPLAYLPLLLVPFVPSKKLSVKIGKYFSYFMYWVENVLFITLFMCFEILMAPLMYLKLFYHIFYIPQSFMTKIIVVVGWLFFGLFVSLFFVFYDTRIFINILRMMDGCQSQKNNQEEEEFEHTKEKQVEIFNQLWVVLRDFYKETRDSFKDDDTSDNDQSGDRSRPSLSNMVSRSIMSLRKQKEEKMIRPTDEDKENYEAFSFSLQVILAEWRDKFYNKARNKKSILSRMVTPRNLDQKMKSSVKSKKNNQDSQSEMNSNKGNKVVPADNTSKESPSAKHNNNGMTKSLSYIDDEQNIDGLEVPIEDEKIAREFLNAFLLNDEGSANSQLNLILFFKSVPRCIKVDKLKRVKFFNFKLFQESLVAYMNTEDVSAFEYHDEKNRDRVALVRNQLNEQKKSLGTVKEALNLLESTIEKGAKKMGKNLDQEDPKQKEEQQKLTNAVINF